MRSDSPSLAALARSYESTRKRAPRSLADLPTSTPQADAFAKQLKSQGYRFVGPTSVYAFMQNVGVVNDHIQGCFRATDYTQRRWRIREMPEQLVGTVEELGPGSVRGIGDWAVLNVNGERRAVSRRRRHLRALMTAVNDDLGAVPGQLERDRSRNSPHVTQHDLGRGESGCRRRALAAPSAEVRRAISARVERCSGL
jgi:Methyladenine glycosylase